MIDTKSPIDAIKDKFKSNAGSTLIIALVVILILVALAMAVLSMSVGNIRLASASRDMNYATELQELIGQYYLTEIDEALKLSEEQTQRYFRNSYFSLSNEDLIAAGLVTGTSASPPDASKITSARGEDDTMKLMLRSGLHKYYAAKWRTDVYEPSQTSQVNNEGKWVSRVNNHTSSKLFDGYYKETFNEVYRYFAYKNIVSLMEKIANQEKQDELIAFVGQNNQLNQTIELTKTKYTMPPLTMTLGTLSKENFERLLNKTNLDATEVASLRNGFEAIKLNFNVELNTGKRLEASLKIKVPDTESIVQRTQRSVYGNPIWSNAITAKGTLTFSPDSRCTIQGDLFSGSVNAEKHSVLIENSTVTVEGNVYAKGNVSLQGRTGKTTNSKFELKPRSNNASVSESAVLNKMKIFDGKGYFLKLSNRNAFGYDEEKEGDSFRASVGNLIQTQGEIESAGTGSTLRETKMPYVLKDSLGGNLYARGLVITPSAKNAEATINGNTVFLDDIVNKSAMSSKINLKGYVIGLDAMGLDISKFGSDLQAIYGIDKSDDGSCIKNFNSTQSNTIQLDAPMIFVPGSAIITDDLNRTYQTGTGIVDFTGNEKILAPYKYFADIAVPGDNNPLADRKQNLSVNGLQIDLGEAEATKKTFIENNQINGFIGKNLADTNITINLTSSQKKSYIKGTTLLKVGTGNNAKIGNNYMHVLSPNNPNNYFNTYNALYAEYTTALGKDASLASEYQNMYYYEYLYRIFKSKTQYLGLWDIEDIMNLINRKAITDPKTQQYRSSAETGIIALKPTAAGQAITYDLNKMEASSGAETFGTNEGKVVRGVIFADGDLNLTASALTTFRGVIIANGNVTINGNLRLIYDEQVMNSLFMPPAGAASATASLRHVYAADFFQPGETGVKLFTQDRETKSARGRKLVVGERLTLEKWVVKR